MSTNTPTLAVRHPPLELWRHALVDAEARLVDPALTRWFGLDGVKANLHRAIDYIGSAMARHDQAADHSGAPLLNDGPHAIPRLVRWGSDHGALARMQFRADGHDLRFILLEGLSHIPTNGGEVDDLLGTLREEFHPFDPALLCAFIHGGASETESVMARRPGAEPYVRFLGARFDDLRAMASPADTQRIEAASPTDYNFYDEYVGHYHAFWQARPDLRHLVRIEPLEDLKEYERAGGLRIIRIDGVMAGIMAATPCIEHGLRGWRMRERFLYPTQRGRALGPASLWMFIRSLPAADDEVLYGTISPRNQPSLKSALRVGRVDIGAMYWLPLA